MTWLYGLVAGLFIGVMGTIAFTVARVQALSSVDFTIAPPPGASEVLLSVREAERRYYADQNLPRRAIEMAQDIGAFLYPPMVYRLDFSVGPFRLKGHTLSEIIPWALDRGYLVVHSAPEKDFHWTYVYFAEQPGLADWGASLYLEYLRQQHPKLRGIPWPEIAADPMLVAKMYSGYLGAGGDWDTWSAKSAARKRGPRALGPLALTRQLRSEYHMRRFFNSYPAIAVTVLSAVYFALLAAPAAMSSMAFGGDPAQTPRSVPDGQLPWEILLAASVVLIAFWLRWDREARISSRPAWGGLWYALPPTLITLALLGAGYISALDTELDLSALWAAGIFQRAFLLIVFVGIFEEVLFRGLVLHGYERRIGPVE